MTRYLPYWLGLCLLATVALADEPPSWRVVQQHPHDTSAFTQGLAFHNGLLYESSGNYGASNIRRGSPDSPEVLAIDLPDRYFAEGLTLLGDNLYLLTWREHELLRFDPQTLTLQQSLRYKGEGWGITTDGTHLITSDGSDRILFRDPATLTVMASIDVRENGQPVKNINELEWVNGALWANVWLQSRIICIDPDSGEVTHSLDLSPLAEGEAATRDDPDNTLNGMAWNPATHTLWVTGKRWQFLYELQSPFF